MGYQWSRRALHTPGIEASGNSTFTGNVVLGADLVLPVESVTSSTALQTLSDHGVSFVTVASSGAGRDFKLPAPPAAGAVKYVYVINNTTSVDTRILAHTTAVANTFWGTTFNEAALAAASTGSPGGTPDGTVGLMLVAASTAQWAVTAFGSTNWTFAATTGSTGQ